MILLIWTEIKKLFKNKLNLILLLLVLFVPLVVTFVSQLSEYHSSEVTGVEMNALEYLKTYQKYQKRYRGKVTEEWVSNLEAQYHKLETSNHDLNDEQVIEMAVLRKSIDFGHYILDETWRKENNGNDHSWGYDENGNLIYLSQEARPGVEMDLITHSFEAENHIYAGDTTSWKQAIAAISSYGVVFTFYFIYLFSSMYNKENKDKMMSLIKTSKNGKRKLGIAKLLAGLLVAILLPLAIIGIVFVFYQCIFGFGNPNVSFLFQLFENSDVASTFTCGETFGIASLLLIIGSLTIAILSMFFSSMMKSSYRSLAISFVFFILPLALNTEIGTFAIKLLSPVEYLNSSFYSFSLISSIGSYAFFNVHFILQTSIWILILVPFIYLFYKNMQITNEG